MVKTKKYHRVALLMLSVLLIALSFAACNKAPQLSAPANLRISGTTLAWDGVENVISYSIQIDDNEPIAGITETFYSLADLPKSGTYSVKVKAVGDGEIYSDSDWSQAKIYKSAPIIVTVSFDLQGGSGIAEPKTATYGKNYGDLPDELTKTGYVFAGWRTSANAGTAVMPATIVTNAENHTLYAYWVTPTQGLKYALINNDTEYEVSGIGTATDKDIFIPDVYDGKPVTSIGNSAFLFGFSLTSITIPNSVTRIGQDAFYKCGKLTSITIPDSVTRIGKDAFADTDIYNNTANNSVVYVGKWVVGYKGSLSGSVSLKNDTVGLIDYAFYSESAFDGCSGMTSINIPNSITRISESAFHGCSGLTSVTIPDSVISIGDRAFNGCGGLPSVTIPDSVTSIGEAAFASCRRLTSITVDSLNAYYSNSTDGVLFDKLQTVLVCYPNGKPDASYTIPDSVTRIGNYAFYDCSGVINIPDDGLLSVIIPGSVTSIGNYAFAVCRDLPSITIPDSVTSIGDYAFAYCGSLTSITIPDNVISMGDYIFQSCSKLTSITIGSGVTSIGDYAFNSCRDLTSITIPDNVTSIGKYAFQFCSKLTSVTIGSGATSIGYAAFGSCGSLTSIIIHDSVTNMSSAFSSCNNLTIYAEASSKPSSWNSSWNNSNRPVIWGCTLSTDKTYVVSFVKSANCINNPTATNGISAPFREGYTFGGWSTVEDGTTAAYTAANVNTAPDDTTLYAIWIEE